MLGYHRKILRINLSTRTHAIEEPPEAYYRHYLGGRGIIIHTLLTELPPGTDPLGPENRLIFAPGPLTGHPLPGSGRNSVGAKSPLTGGFGEAEAGGFWGAELKRSGFDALIVEGASAVPVYLLIRDGEPEIRDAGRLWGMEIADADAAIRAELGDDKVRTALIGPGGEKLVRYACIANDITHMAGRTGLGAVMGSKRLKAIAVRGETAPEIADRPKLLALSRWMAKNFKEKASRHYLVGTGSPMRQYESTGNLPVCNFRGGSFPGVLNIMPQQLFEKGHVKKRESCYACPVRCKRVVSLEKPWKVDIRYGGPEYETLGALGANCGVDHLEALMKANEICARHGIDTISTGVSISFAMECYEKGILTAEQTDGLELTFGNAAAMLEMVERIAQRRGLGDLLAEGTKRAAESIGRGSAKFAIQVKGVELPMHEPRYKQGMGLHYSVNAAGADHCSGVQDDQVQNSQPRWKTLATTEMSPRKAEMVYEVGLWRHMANYIGMCVFLPWSHQQITEAMEAVTGGPIDSGMLAAAVERGITLARIFNLRQGFSRADDKLPERFFSPSPEGPLKDIAIDPLQLKIAQQAYYRMMGWDEEGIPTREKLAALEIEWATGYLKNETSQP